MDSTLYAHLPNAIVKAMERYDQLYAASLESESLTLEKVTERINRNTGKRIRPLLLVLVASSYGEVTDEVLNGAVFIEQLHISTLLHDDVIDESLERRGQPSVNAIFGNKKAVLIGDFILASAMMSALMTNNKQIVSRLTMLGKLLSEGELMQMDAAELRETSEAFYFKIIERKTASLIKASMEIGAILAGEKDEAVIDRIGEAARLLGLAFQIRDDIFDYVPTKQLGKPSGQDIREHKYTLPLLYALNQPTKEAQKAERILRHQELAESQIKYLIEFTRKQGGIDYAYQRMSEYIAESKRILKELIRPGDSLDALLYVCDYVEGRNK